MLAPAAISFGAWLVPGGDRVTQGFDVRAHLDFLSLLMILGWYLAAALVVITGVRAGRRLRPLGRPRSYEQRAMVETRGYWLITAVATVGVVYSLYVVSASVSIVDVLRAQQANALYDALPDSFGVQTLRYAAAISSAIAIHRVVLTRRVTGLTLWNIALLGVAALLASRLSLVLALLLFFFLLTRSHPHLRVRPAAVAAGLAAFFLLLLPLSYSRNAKFYASAGVHGASAVNAAQIWSYLSTPAQVAVGVAHNAVNGNVDVIGSPEDAASVLRPTYFDTKKTGKDVGLDVRIYGEGVDVAPNYTTNSALADTLARYGASGLVVALFGYWVAAYAFGHLERYGGLTSCAAGVLLYAFAETWRVYLLNQGIVHFLVLTSVAVGAISRTRAVHYRRESLQTVETRSFRSSMSRAR